MSTVYCSPLCISVKTGVVTISDVACTLEAELLAMAVVEMVVTSAVAIIMHNVLWVWTMQS